MCYPVHISRHRGRKSEHCYTIIGVASPAKKLPTNAEATAIKKPSENPKRVSFCVFIHQMNFMAFLPISGPIRSESFPKTASTAIAVGDALETASGAMNPADAADVSLFGVSMQKIASTDADYASTTLIGVWIMDPQTEWLADVGTGTATAALVGTKCDLAAAGTLDVTATSHNVFTITKFISATQVVGRFNASYIFRNAA